eukprot:207659_1
MSTITSPSAGLGGVAGVFSRPSLESSETPHGPLSPFSRKKMPCYPGSPKDQTVEQRPSIVISQSDSPEIPLLEKSEKSVYDKNDHHDTVPKGVCGDITQRLHSKLIGITSEIQNAFASVSGSSGQFSWSRMGSQFSKLHSKSREKLMFLASTIIGTILFAFVYHSFFIFTNGYFEDIQLAFSLSYLISYFISVIWQHALNRWLVPWTNSVPYWRSLGETYLVYGITVVVSWFFGALLIQLFHMPQQFVIILTLLASGLCNYYLLRRCFQIERQREIPDVVLV